METVSVKKKLIYFFLMFLLAAIAGLSTAELATRILCRQEELIKWIIPDDKYGFVNKKNFDGTYHFLNSDFIMEVKINSLGLRGEEYDLTRSDIKKVLLLGDSFGFGHGINIEDHFATKLEEMLNQTGENFIAINAGVHGWGTLQEVSYAKDHMKLFTPDVVVITFCGNDPRDDLRFKLKMVDLEKGVIQFPGKAFLRRHSHLYRLVFLKYHEMVHNWIINKKTEGSNKIIRNNLMEKQGVGIYKRLERDDHVEKNIAIDKQSAHIISEEHWNATLGYIRDFHKDFLKFNSNGILLVQATNPLDGNIRKHLNLLSNGKNLIYVDLYNDASLFSPEQLRLPYDDHWSSQMHLISAKNLCQVITESKTFQNLKE